MMQPDVTAEKVGARESQIIEQEIRAAAAPHSNIAALLKAIKASSTPVMTSRKHPDYPALVEFPLEDVLNHLGHAYFNSTAAYAIAFAIHIGVKKISFYGIDFTYDNQHHGERGRACCEYWIGLCMADGIEIQLASKTALMDACAPPAERLYGYDGVDVIFKDGPDGELQLEFQPKPLPSAEEIERRYDHTQPTNRLLAEEKANEGKS